MMVKLILTHLLLGILVLATGPVLADEAVLGIWENKQDGLRLDILDGFKANRGVALAIQSSGEIRVGSWKTTASGTTISIGWIDGPVTMEGPTTLVWEDRPFGKVRGAQGRHDRDTAARRSWFHFRPGRPYVADQWRTRRTATFGLQAHVQHG